MSKLQMIFDTGQVRRYHTHPRMAREGQNDAEHAWGCAALLLMLHPDPSKELLAEVILHDTGEFGVGDLAHGFKVEHPAIAEVHKGLEERWRREQGIPWYELNETERLWLRFVDRLESYIYMKSRGCRWDSKNKQELIDTAYRLGVSDELEDLLND